MCFDGTGSDRGHDKFGASSSDSEEEALDKLRTTSRRPSTNYRPEFAAKTLAQVLHTHPDMQC